jgi:hypothetical protein
MAETDAFTRRSFFALAPASAFVIANASADASAAPTSDGQDERRQLGYAETAHVRTYYALARG